MFFVVEAARGLRSYTLGANQPVTHKCLIVLATRWSGNLIHSGICVPGAHLRYIHHAGRTKGRAGATPAAHKPRRSRRSPLQSRKQRHTARCPSTAGVMALAVFSHYGGDLTYVNLTSRRWRAEPKIGAVDVSTQCNSGVGSQQHCSCDRSLRVFEV